MNRGRIQGLVVLGRILLVAIFLLSAFNKMTHWGQTVGYMSSMGMPAANFFLVMAILLELAGGISLLVDFKPRIGALLLVLFILPATLIFHRFWSETDPMMRQNQFIHFMKNLSILGALLFVAGIGSEADEATGI
jgi:putative oxidoreductase